MELDDLKSTWKSIKPHIGSTQIQENNIAMTNKRKDIRSRLLSRYFWSCITTLSGLVLSATSGIWSPLNIPSWWLSAFCMMCLVGAVCEIWMYLIIKRINIWEDSNAKIFSSVVKIRKIYRNTELAISIIIMPLLLWLSFIPPFAYSWRMIFVWILTIVAFSGEYIWYRSNLKQLNRLSNWNKEP